MCGPHATDIDGVVCPQERMANMLNDCEISPTNYMIAFLRQRGWYLPETTMRIPNVIPEVDPIAAKVTPSPACSGCSSGFGH